MKTKDHPIQRKFLLLEQAPKIVSVKEIEIEQGYIARHPLHDLRLQRRDKKHFIALREKKGAKIISKELPITKAQFEALWHFTEGQRIHRKRSLFVMKNLKWKIDRFVGEHAPLQIAEILFSNTAESKAFQKPDFLGEEITYREEYETAEMALHGAPEKNGLCQIGIFPYIFKDRKLHVLLVTSSSGSRWILPKGRQEPDMTPHEVATMEAVEEAGALGTLRPDVRIRCQMNDGRFLQLYAMKISKLLSTWPEENIRLRRLLPVTEALEIIEDTSVTRAMRRLAAQLNKETASVQKMSSTS